MDYIKFSIWVLGDKSSFNIGYFCGKSTKQDTSQNFLTKKIPKLLISNPEKS